MKKKFLLGLFLIALCTTAYAFEWPQEAAEIVLNHQRLSVRWREGRPIARRDEVFNVLRLSREGDADIDLISALEKVKASIRQRADGVIDITVIKEVTASGPGVGVSRAEGSQAARFRAEFEAQQEAQRLAPRLVARGFRYVADTEFIRALVVVRNEGYTASKPTMAKGEFIDWFGHPFATHTLAVPALDPGESTEMTFFSMVHKDEANEKKGDKYTLRVTFASQGGDGRRLDGSR